MTILRGAEELAQFVRTLPGFVLHERIDGNFHHIGATVADALLQVNYGETAQSLTNTLLTRYPDARTTSVILPLLNSIEATEFLSLPDAELADCFRRTLTLFASEGIESETELHAWLMAGVGLWKLRSIKGVGPKTVDYLKVMAGVSCRVVGRHLLNFLGLAGIAPRDDDEARAILNAAANLLGIPPACFDYSIWRYMQQLESRRTAKKLTTWQPIVAKAVAKPPDARVPEHGAKAGSIAVALVLIAGGAFYYLNSGNPPMDSPGQPKFSKIRRPSTVDKGQPPLTGSVISDAILAELAGGGSTLQARPVEHKKPAIEMVDMDACEDQYFAPDDYDQESPLARPYQALAKLLREARQGHANAQRMLASYYEQGYLVSRCDEKAAYWYQHASAGGDGPAIQWMRKQEQLAVMHRSPECAGTSCEPLFQRAGMAVEPEHAPPLPDGTGRSDRTMAMLRNAGDEHAL